LIDYHSSIKKEPNTVHQTNRRIFFFERFNFFKDKVRSEDELIAGKLNGLLLAAYGKIGYDIIMVPVMPVKDRADLVLSNVN